MNNEIKYWLYYIHYDDDEISLYAYTDNKEFAKSFEHERNMNLFNRVKRKLSREEINFLAREYQNCYLEKVKMNIYDKEKHEWFEGSFIMSVSEKLTLSTSEIRLIESDIYQYCWYDPCIFKDNIFNSLEILEYNNVYKQITTTKYDNDNISINLKPDTLGIFLYHFGKTMKG